MEIDLAGKVALVSASTKGMGYACAELYARSGANVTVMSRDENNVVAAKKKLEQIAPGRILGLRADVANDTEVKNAIAQTLSAFGKIDILLNNAGGPRPGRIVDLTEEDWQTAFNLTLMSTVRCCRYVLPSMRENRWGRIVNITSILAKAPNPNMGLSNSFRAGVLGYAKTLSREVAADGITVNSLCPGAVATDRFINLNKLEAEERKMEYSEVIKEVEEDIPAGFVAEPKDFAQIALFLSSEEARYITGTVTQVDGGEYRGLF